MYAGSGAREPLNFTASSKRLVVSVESLLLKSGPAKAGPARPGATPMKRHYAHRNEGHACKSHRDNFSQFTGRRSNQKIS